MKQFYSKYKWTLWFVVVTLLGMLARLIWILKIPNIPVSDFKGYWEIAKNIVDGLGVSQRGEPRAFQGPGYPLTLALFYKIVGTTSIFAGKILNLILSTATLVAAYFILKRLFSKPGLVLFTYICLTFLPNYIAFSSVIGTEITYTFFMTMTLFFQFSPMKRRWRYPLMGIFIGLTALTRPYFLAYPVIVAVAEWLRHKSFRETMVAGLATGLVMIAVISPWTIRNYIVFDTFVPVASNGGYVLYVNNNDFNWTGGWIHPDGILEVRDSFLDKFTKIGVTYPEHPPQADKLYSEEAMHWIKNNPIPFFQLAVIRVKNTFFNGAEDIEKWTMNQLRENLPSKTKVEIERDLKFGRAVTDTIIYVLSSFGLIYVILHIKDILLSLFRKKTTITFGASVICMNIAFYAAIFFVTEGQPRYNYPVLMFLVIAAAASWDILHKNLRTSDLR